MSKSDRPPSPSPSPSGRTNLASCVVATIFLIFLLIVIFTVYFTVFKPQNPKISVKAVQLPSFSVVTNGTVNFTFSQYASVKNPNRGTFSHFDSSFQLLYHGRQVGFMFVPAGKISAGRRKYMAATFKVEDLELGFGPSSDGNGINGPGGSTMELESRIEMVGRVRVLHLFSHHVEAKVGCVIDIAVSDGTILGFHC